MSRLPTYPTAGTGRPKAAAHPDTGWDEDELTPHFTTAVAEWVLDNGT
jgi:hypothetical protein